jgi:hypothetical protein
LTAKNRKLLAGPPASTNKTGDGTASRLPKKSLSEVKPKNPDLPWQNKVKIQHLIVLEMKQEDPRKARRGRARRAGVDGSLPVTQKPTGWEAVRPLWHFACILSLLYMLIFAVSDWGANYLGGEILQGREPAGHGAFCYVQRLLDFGPLNTSYLAEKAMCPPSIQLTQTVR